MCPLCEQAIEREALLVRLKQRIEADEKITAASSVVTDRIKTLQQFLEPMIVRYQSFINDWNNDLTAPVPTNYVDALALLFSLSDQLKDGSPDASRLAQIASQFASAAIDHNEASMAIDSLISKEGGGSQRAHIAATVTMIEELLNRAPLMQAAVLKSKRTQRQLYAVTRLHGHAISARKKAATATLEDVIETANSFYERIHPNEGIAKSDLEVRQVGKGSVSLFTEFYGRTKENPLLHHSESHLDTLGLCYFLAMRKLEASNSPEFKVLVLDDIMHSVDSDHRGRIAELILDEFADHQVIITTHDIHFYEALARRIASAPFAKYRINNWDIERGPILGDPLTDLDRIIDEAEREKISPENLAISGGRFFEWLLKEVIESLQISIPGRFKKSHDIGSMWPPFAKRLRQQKEFRAQYEKLMIDLENDSWVRNACGGHYNPSSAPATPAEARRYAELLTELYVALYCSGCGAFISRRADGSWQCDCGGKKYL